VSSLARRTLAAALLAGVGLVLMAPAASAHPLGNFTTNTAAALQVSADRLVVEYAIDTAEIPTVRAMSSIDTDGDGAASASELDAYRVTTCASVAEGLDARVDGKRIALDAGEGRAALAPGAAGLDVLRVECSLSAVARFDDGDHTVAFEDGWVGDLIGWHEVTAVGDGVTLRDSPVPTSSPSDHLRSYPDDALASPPTVTSAEVSTTPGGPMADAQTGGTGAAGSISAIPAVDRASKSFTDLVSTKELTFGVAVVGLLLAIVLGCLHALAPGHGKTVMAAYLIGGEGTAKQALGLCATVTITHTAGVLVLGTVLTVSTVVAPERLYPVLGAISGLLVASIGVTMFRRARRFRTTDALVPLGHVHTHDEQEHVHEHERVLVHAGGHSHDHGRSHDHGHSREHGDDHPHGHTHLHGAGGHSHPDPTEPVSWRSLIGMGFAGGMVPSPSALLVLLGAIALGRTWFGVALVVAYGVGMAVALVAAGLLLLRLRQRLDRYLSTRTGRRMSERLVVLPSVTALLVVGGGLFIAARALLQL